VSCKFLMTVFSVTLLANLLLAATLVQGAQASKPKGQGVLQALTAPVSNNYILERPPLMRRPALIAITCLFVLAGFAASWMGGSQAQARSGAAGTVLDICQPGGDC
jgi:hypothetical protein